VKSWQKILLGVVSVAAIVGGFIAPHSPEHADLWWNSLGVFFAAFGFLGCIVLVYVSKFLGKKFLNRPEDYYGD
jgi:hypothetical protein